MKYNEDVYYYIKNLQEDIIGIKDANFNLVATYKYDSWGKILSIKDSNGIEITDTKHIAHINPFRYRGYYYDEETGLYYLKSRYYNPVWGRFLNADSYAGVNNSILGYNLYIYSNNNPINYSDDTGQFFKKAFNWIKSTVKKVVNTIKNVVTKLKEAFVIEVGAGFGLDAEISTPLKKLDVGVGAYKDMTFTYSAKNNTVTSSTIGHFGASFLIFSVGNDVQHFDDGLETDGRFHDNPFISDLFLKTCPNTYVTNSISVGNKIILEANDTPVTFIGFDLSLHIGIGGHIRIGFTVDDND